MRKGNAGKDRLRCHITLEEAKKGIVHCGCCGKPNLVTAVICEHQIILLSHQIVYLFACHVNTVRGRPKCRISLSMNNSVSGIFGIFLF